MNILVLAEHDHQQLKAETAHVVSAALAMGGKVDVLVAGCQCHSVAEQAALLGGINSVLYCDNPALATPLAENISQLILSLAEGYSHFVAASSSLGKGVMPRVAAKLDVAQVSDIIAVQSADTFTRPIYAGNAIATVQALDAIKVVTVRPSAFAALEQGSPVAINSVDFAEHFAGCRFVSAQLTQSERPELTSARVVVSGGRGLQSGENFALLDALADKLGAAIGASRAAVDAGFVPNDLQVGQTGKIVAPDLYIAVGISGAIQHLAGMKDSKVIVAINKDPDAPIFQLADYGLVGDLFEIVPELTAKL
ncbi:electron transfer flavoprotein subunit alpha/FixB family protein [Gallaecimonas mangrovi]|uniref:electron transfer flavoprotein subunit alpha/FixB family protein n=1 Tax=Gallaecimonas mangrovi TaxID=2291597 RepID=UPI000E202C75|nr:FAD-binding protein [Gallaecimonas mangrovi]